MRFRQKTCSPIITTRTIHDIFYISILHAFYAFLYLQIPHKCIKIHSMVTNKDESQSDF